VLDTNSYYSSWDLNNFDSDIKTTKSIGNYLNSEYIGGFSDFTGMG
jgi:hypothetical protein